MLQKLAAYLATMQFGVTLASLGLGWLGEPAFARSRAGAHADFPGRAARRLAHTLAVVVGFAIITFLHMVIGELAPEEPGACSGPRRWR